MPSGDWTGCPSGPVAERLSWVFTITVWDWAPNHESGFHQAPMASEPDEVSTASAVGSPCLAISPFAHSLDTCSYCARGLSASPAF